MTVLLVSMPYAKFDSDWFSRVPNINLGSGSACLKAEGHLALAFHLHLDFLPFLSGMPLVTADKFKKLSARGVEYFSLDYLFATLLFPEAYQRSHDKFSKRTSPLGLSMDDLEEMRETAASYIDRCLAKIEPHLDDAGVAAFSCSHFQLSASLLLAAGMKDLHPDISIIMGGKDCAGSSGIQIMNRFPFIDFVGYGECESPLLALVNRPAGTKDPPPGFLYRKRKGKVGRSRNLPAATFDELPFPEYPFESMPIPPGEIILPLELGRGCTWSQCTFCPDQTYGIECRKKTAARITSEIEHYLSASRDLTRFIILDADALKDPAEMSLLSMRLKDKGLTFIFGEFRAERLTRAALGDLMAMGRWGSHFQVGIESFSDRLLELMNKGIPAIKNVEAIKAAAELGTPLQFNIITSFPRMERRDLEENLRVMGLISHLLVRKNIRLYPSEFYLPPDCPIFERDAYYHIRKTRESTFSAVFEDFDLHALGNYPHYLAFDNHEEQMEMSKALRARIDELSRTSPEEDSLTWRQDGPDLIIDLHRSGTQKTWSFSSAEKNLYLAAIDTIRAVADTAREAGIEEDRARAFLDSAEAEGLIIYSSDRKAYFSLASRHEGSSSSLQLSFQTKL